LERERIAKIAGTAKIARIEKQKQIPHCVRNDKGGYEAKDVKRRARPASAPSPLPWEHRDCCQDKGRRAGLSEATRLKDTKIPGGQSDRPVFLLEGRKKGERRRFTD